MLPQRHSLAASLVKVGPTRGGSPGVRRGAAARSGQRGCADLPGRAGPARRERRRSRRPPPSSGRGGSGIGRSARSAGRVSAGVGSGRGGPRGSSRSALRSDPGNADAASEKASALIALGRHEQAIEILEPLVAANPGSPSLDTAVSPTRWRPKRATRRRCRATPRCSQGILATPTLDCDSPPHRRSMAVTLWPSRCSKKG